MIVASFPSPEQGVWHLGPLPIRAYALCILLGVVVALWVGDRRWRERGGSGGTIGDIAVWALPFGLVGARLYHVITDPELYFDPGRNPWQAFYIWDGGLGIWGAVGLGALGAYFGSRRLKISFPALADAVAPGIVLAQAIGRWGNYFNQELYGRPSSLPWAVRISPSHREPGMADQATYQPTFLYESIWDVGVFGLVIWADRRFKLGHGRAFALYVMAYTFGRGWIEYLRVDTANHILGVRLNVWTAALLFTLALVYFLVSQRVRPGRETVVEFGRNAPSTGPAVDDEGVSDGDGAAEDGDPETSQTTDPVVEDGVLPDGVTADGVPPDEGDKPPDGEAPGGESPAEEPETAAHD